MCRAVQTGAVLRITGNPKRLRSSGGASFAFAIIWQFTENMTSFSVGDRLSKWLDRNDAGKQPVFLHTVRKKVYHAFEMSADDATGYFCKIIGEFVHYNYIRILRITVINLKHNEVYYVNI